MQKLNICDTNSYLIAITKADHILHSTGFIHIRNCVAEMMSKQKIANHIDQLIEGTFDVVNIPIQVIAVGMMVLERPEQIQDLLHLCHKHHVWYPIDGTVSVGRRLYNLRCRLDDPSEDAVIRLNTSPAARCVTKALLQLDEALVERGYGTLNNLIEK